MEYNSDKLFIGPTVVFFLRKHVDVMYDIKKKFGSQQCNPVAASYDPGFVSTGDSREILQGTAATYAG